MKYFYLTTLLTIIHVFTFAQNSNKQVEKQEVQNLINVSFIQAYENLKSPKAFLDGTHKDFKQITNAYGVVNCRSRAKMEGQIRHGRFDRNRIDPDITAEFESIDIVGGEATAKVKVYNKQQFTHIYNFTLVKADGDWKIMKNISVRI
ncbi:MAG: hypothetical protein ACEPOV_01795 [Hyphomicrobiales bacterium]